MEAEKERHGRGGKQTFVLSKGDFSLSARHWDFQFSVKALNTNSAIRK